MNKLILYHQFVLQILRYNNEKLVPEIPESKMLTFM